jgi:hypothetical protein
MSSKPIETKEDFDVIGSWKNSSEDVGLSESKDV